MKQQQLKIEWTHKRQVAHLVLNSPENLNAMDLSMAKEFRLAKDVLKSESDLRYVVVRAEGRAFSAGGDLEMLRLKAQKTLQQNEEEMLDFYHSFLGLRDLNLPLICALHGHVVGAGFCFSAACDIRIADPSALMAAPFTRLALHPGMGGSFFLPRTLGSELARNLMLTGRRMPADEAYRAGFLTDVSESGKLLECLERLLQTLLKSAPYATQRLLKSERESLEVELREALLNEAKEQALCYAHPEFLLGVEALQKKQTPPWCCPT